MLTLAFVSLLHTQQVPSQVVDTREVIVVSSTVRCERRELTQGSGTVRVCEYVKEGGT